MSKLVDMPGKVGLALRFASDSRWMLYRLKTIVLSFIASSLRGAPISAGPNIAPISRLLVLTGSWTGLFAKVMCPARLAAVHTEEKSCVG